VRHWDRDWEACDTYRSPNGFAKLTGHVARIMGESDAQKQKELIRSEDSFNLWQSILRGAGVITGCRRCADVCPVGTDYAQLKDALDVIPEHTPQKQAALDAMTADESRSALPAAYTTHMRWIGTLPAAKK
jgi:epoxyqueuosine reductase